MDRIIAEFFYCKLCGNRTKPVRVPEMVEYCPQLKHLANPFVESCAERNFVRQGNRHVRVS
jgi:hypothetical protein